METIARTYRIPTSLSIAVARLRAVMPSSMLYSENGIYQYGAEEIVAHFRFSNNDAPILVQFLKGDYPDDEAHTFTVQVRRYLAWRGPWQVVLSRESPWEMHWLYAGVKVTVDQRTGDMRAERGSATQQRRAIWAVGQRLAGFQSNVPEDLWRWKLKCRVVAVAPAEVYVLFETRGKLIEAWQRADAFIRGFWAQEARQEQGDSSFTPLLQNAGVPEEPALDTPLSDWFDYYHKQKEAGRRITLKEIAKKTGFTESHIRKQHALYKNQAQKTGNKIWNKK